MNNMTIIASFYLPSTVLRLYVLSHLILIRFLGLSSYLYHTYTDGNDSNIQKVGMKPQFCFVITTLGKKITGMNDIIQYVNLIRKVILDSSLYLFNTKIYIRCYIFISFACLKSQG